MFRVVIAGLLCLLAVADGARFEAASIRPAADDAVFYAKPPANGRFTGTAVGARLMVMLAYGVQESQIEGGPEWFATDRWTVTAKGDPGGDARVMLQNMLEERFGLRVHREKRERSFYALRVANGGSKMKVSEAASTNVRIGRNSVGMERGDLARLTQLLATIVEKPVVDETGLTGSYDVSLQWDDGVDSNADSIFTAIQNQAGLRLVSVRAPVEMLVIDKIERPSGN